MRMLRPRPTILQQPQHAEHAGHRRPDLMAHGGQEVGLGAASALRGFARRGMARHLMLELRCTLRHQFAEFLAVAA